MAWISLFRLGPTGAGPEGDRRSGRSSPRSLKPPPNEGFRSNERRGSKPPAPPPSFPRKHSRHKTGLLPFGLNGTVHEFPHSLHRAGKLGLSKPPPKPPRFPPPPPP